MTSIEQELRREIPWDHVIEAFLAAVDATPDIEADLDDPDIGIDRKDVLKLQKSRYDNSDWNEKL